MLTFLRDCVTRWRTYKRIHAELSQHNHRQLYDLRIGPGDIELVARRAAGNAAV